MHQVLLVREVVVDRIRVHLTVLQWRVWFTRFSMKVNDIWLRGMMFPCIRDVYVTGVRFSFLLYLS